MTDIVETLRSGGLCGDDKCRVMDKAGGCTCFIAAAEIERLREALKHIAAIYHVRIDDVRGNLWEHQRIALAALKEADK